MNINSIFYIVLLSLFFLISFGGVVLRLIRYRKGKNVPIVQALTLSDETIVRISKLTFFFFLMSTVLFAVFSQGGYSDDDYAHYLYSHYSLFHHVLILDLWNRPVFTFLTMLPAQLGFIYFRLTNVVISAVTVYLTYLLAKRKKLVHPALVFPLLSFASYFFLLSFSGLTEPAFGLFLIIFLLLKDTQKENLSALAAGCLPFIRPEGIVILPFIVISYIRKRSYLPIIILIIPAFIYMVLSFLITGDALFGLKSIPYLGSDVFGKGSVFHYARTLINVTGPVVFILFQIGFLSSLRQRLTLSHIIVIAVFAAHTYMWVHGNMGSAGYSRVLTPFLPILVLWAITGIGNLRTMNKKEIMFWTIVCITEGILLFRFPPVGIVGVKSLHASYFFGYYGATIAGCVVFLLLLHRTHLPIVKKFLFSSFLVIIIAISVWEPILRFRPPIKHDSEHLLADTVVSTVTHLPSWNNRPFITFQPYLFIKLSKDPWQKPNGYLADLKNTTPPKGAIVVWDSHYGKLLQDIDESFFSETGYTRIATVSSNTIKFNGLKPSPFYYAIYEKK